MQRRLNLQPEAMTLRRYTVEYVFGTLKHWMGSTHFLMRRLVNVGTEMSLQVLAYNLKRLINVLGYCQNDEGGQFDGGMSPLSAPSGPRQSTFHQTTYCGWRTA